MPSPILIPCEGSGSKSWYCPMCAIPANHVDHGLWLVPEHDRRDILAELDRGDFDEAVS